MQTNSGYQPRSSMEDCLQPSDDLGRNSIQDSVAIVDSADDECLNDGTQRFERQRAAHRPKLTKLVEAASGNDGDMLLHCQSRIKRDTKVTNAVKWSNVSAPNRQTYTSHLFQLLGRTKPDKLRLVGVEFEAIG
jgi:hypothetical protein